MKGKLLRAAQLIGGRYEVSGWIGEGGMQEVYLAQDKLLGRDVALKTPKDNAAEKRFRRSAVVSAKVNQNNVAKTLDYIEDGDRAYLVEELILGSDLAKIMRGHLPYIPPQAAARVLHQLARGVGASHNAGVVHRDMKPSNIMVVGGQRFDEIKVTDFGIAKMAEEELAGWAEGDDKTATSSRTVLGAIPYMAPESITAFKSAGQPADVWAIGAIVYELLSGEKPFGQGLAAVPAILDGLRPKLPAYIQAQQFRTLGNELMSLIFSCMTLDPATRPTAADLMTRCEALCYTNDTYETGSISSIQNQYFGFLRVEGGGNGFYHRESFYGDSKITVGSKVWFARHKGGGSDRVFPIVKLRQRPEK